MTNKKKFIWILILGLLSAIGPFSIDMYLPGFPAIAKGLHTTIAKVQLSLSSFFIGICFGQLLYGPLLDRFGRKKPLYIGLLLYIVSSIGCAFASSVDMLIILRLFQALGGCVGLVASRAMVRDLFAVEENAKIFSLLMLVIGISPIIAPTLGGYVTAAWGWHYVFIVLTIITTLILIGVHFILPESRQPDTSLSLRPSAITKSFIVVLKDPQFYTFALTGAAASAGLYAYISGSPFVFMQLFNVTEKQYGGIFASIAICLIVSSQVNTFLLRTFTSKQIIRVALFFQSLAGILLFIGSSYNVLGLYGTVGLICVFLSCQGFVFPNSSALSMAPFSNNAGSASAVLGSIQLGVGAITSALVSVLSNNTALPMAGVMAGCAITSFSILLIGNKVIKFKTSAAQVEEQSAEMMPT